MVRSGQGAMRENDLCHFWAEAERNTSAISMCSPHLLWQKAALLMVNFYESGSPGDHAEHRTSSKCSEHVALARSELLSREANGVLRFICHLIDS